VRLEALTADWVQQHRLQLQDRRKQPAGILQVRFGAL
jgi:hypothetical protein